MMRKKLKGKSTSVNWLIFSPAITLLAKDNAITKRRCILSQFFVSQKRDQRNADCNYSYSFSSEWIFTKVATNTDISAHLNASNNLQNFERKTKAFYSIFFFTFPFRKNTFIEKVKLSFIRMYKYQAFR